MKELGRHHSSIARERNRGNKDGSYHADEAHFAYTERRSACKPLGSFTLELAKELQAKLQQTWSPEQIAEKPRASGETFVCFKTIYRWLYDGRLAKGDMKLLRQRGSNENGNGLLREFFPKGKDLAEVSDQELAHALRLINNRPRKCLGWKSAHELFMDALSHLA
jgi:IS30 family transposase